MIITNINIIDNNNYFYCAIIFVLRVSSFNKIVNYCHDLNQMVLSSFFEETLRLSYCMLPDPVAFVTKPGK